MNKIIRSATSSFAIFLNAAATFAGPWTDVPGGAPGYSALYAVAAVSANDVWAVGGYGHNNSRAMIEHWDGTAWSAAIVGEFGSQLYGVAAASPTHIWAVGQNVTGQTLVELWNGQRWVVVPSPSIGTYDILYGVSTISRNDAWAVGNSLVDGYILMHWDGISWSLANGPSIDAGLFAVKAFATDDVWAVGVKINSDDTQSPFTLHWDGTAWIEVSSPPGVDFYNLLFGVDGASPNDVWAVGYSANNPPGVFHTLALHWDGAVWTVVPTPVRNDNSEFFAVTALSSTSVVAVGQSNETPYSERWDGTQWHVGPTPPVTDNFGLLFGVSNRDGSAWAVGYQGFGHGEPDDLILNWTR